MLRLHISQAKPGMELALPIHHPRLPEIVLLRQGVPLDTFSIPHLAELGVEDLWIHYPGLEHLVRFADPQLHRMYRSLSAKVGVILDQSLVRSPVELDFHAAKRALSAIVQRLHERPHANVWLAQIAGGERPFVRHCGAVAALSLMMGIKLDFYLVRERSRLPAGRAKDVSSLGVGALLHDIGMARLPAHVLERYNRTQDESDPEYQAHVTQGFAMVQGLLDPPAAAVILHHHQAFDGSGFPTRADLHNVQRPVAGRDIHVFARIVAAADLFDRLQNPAHAPGSLDDPHKRVPTVRVLRQLIASPAGKRLDPVVLKALVQVAPPYPPGSVVTLSNSKLAAVVDWTPKDPCRPTVELLDACLVVPRKHRRPPQRINLAQRPDLSIVEIDGHDVSTDNFEPRETGEFDLLETMQRMENRAMDPNADLAPAPTAPTLADELDQ